MKVIVIRQPWAWLIVHGFKDIENRSWSTQYRGRLLIQASANLPAKGKLEEGETPLKKSGRYVPDHGPYAAGVDGYLERKGVFHGLQPFLLGVAHPALAPERSEGYFPYSSSR